VQIKHLLEHLTGLLAAAFAVLFVVGAIYCIVLLNTIGPAAFFHVTFTDVVNISIRAARVPLLIALFIGFMSTVLSQRQFDSIARFTSHVHAFYTWYFHLFRLEDLRAPARRRRLRARRSKS
jgi:hypothetical protein